MKSRNSVFSMGKSSELTAAQKVINSFEKGFRRVIAKITCYSQGYKWKAKWKKKTAAEKRFTNNSDRHSLKRCVKQRRKSVWKRSVVCRLVGVHQSSSDTHTCVQDMGYKCYISWVKLLLNQTQCLWLLTGAKSTFRIKVKKVNFAFQLEH